MHNLQCNFNKLTYNKLVINELQLYLLKFKTKFMKRMRMNRAEYEQLLVSRGKDTAGKLRDDNEKRGFILFTPIFID